MDGETYPNRNSDRCASTFCISCGKHLNNTYYIAGVFETLYQLEPHRHPEVGASVLIFRGRKLRRREVRLPVWTRLRGHSRPNTKAAIRVPPGWLWNPRLGAPGPHGPAPGTQLCPPRPSCTLAGVAVGTWIWSRQERPHHGNGQTPRPGPIAAVTGTERRASILPDASPDPTLPDTGHATATQTPAPVT